MPLGRSPRVQRRGPPPSHTSCRPIVTDPPWRCSRTDCAIMALVFAISWMLYWSTLDADFAYDDSRAIKTNQDLLPTTPITSVLQNDFWGTPLTHSGSHKSYRPICVLSFRLNYFLGGLDPSGYHLMNVILHSVVSVIFTRLASMVFVKHIIPTMVTGILFAVHPVHTEAVAGVVGRADVGACLFFLLSFLCYIRYCEYRDAGDEHYPRRWFYLYGCIALATLSMLTKEHGVTVLAVCAVYDLLVHHKVKLVELAGLAFDQRFQGLREGLLHIGGTAVTVLGLRLHLMGSKPPDFAPADNPAADNNCFITRTLTFFFLPAYNFWLLLFPRWLSFDWSMDSIPLLTTFTDYRNLFSLLFYGIFIAFGYWLVKSLNKRGELCDNVFNQSAHCAAVNAARLRKFPFQSDGGIKKFLFSHAFTRGFAESIFDRESVKTFKKYSFQFLNNNNYTQLPHSNGHKLPNGHINHSTHSGGSHGHSHHHHHGNGSNHSFWKSRFVCQCTWTPFINAMEVVTFAIALIILPFIPATNLFFYVGFVVAERVLYIPSMGFCLLIGLGIDHLYKHSKTTWTKSILMAAVFALMLIMSVRTVVRNDDWRTEENLYRSGIPVNPPKAYGNLANILSGQGKKEEAEIAYKKALSYRSNMADVRYNLGILLQEQGRYEEALYSYKLAIQFRPRLAMAYLNLGLVLGVIGRKDEAAEVYRLCAELDSAGLKDPKMHESTRISALFNLGRLYADDGRYEEAMEVYYEAVQKMPDYYQPQSLYNMMGEAFFKMGQFAEAEHWYLDALRVKPDHIPAHLTYAKLLSKWNRLADAEKWFLKAKAVAPNDSSVYQHYGQFLSETERHVEAAEIYVMAAQLAADDYEIIFNAANTLRQAGKNVEAEMYYQMAVKLKPNEVTTHMNLGAMLHVNGKLQEAESSYLEALKLRPDDPITQNNLQKLRNLLAHKNAIKASKAENGANTETAKNRDSSTDTGNIRNSESRENAVKTAKAKLENIANAKKPGSVESTSNEDKAEFVVNSTDDESSGNHVTHAKSRSSGNIGKVSKNGESYKAKSGHPDKDITSQKGEASSKVRIPPKNFGHTKNMDGKNAVPAEKEN